MSELSELIEINRNIEKQNEEIIRLLKIIAKQDNDGEMTIPYVAPREIASPDTSFEFDESCDVGEVHFIEEKNVFRLTVKNNEMSIDNLTGSTEACNYAEQEIVAYESVKLNHPLDAATVILNSEQSLNLPETLKMCYEIKAKNVYVPLYSMAQLVGAPERLMSVMKIDFYRTDDELLKKVFGKGD